MLRDIQADWKHWSPAERFAATLLMGFAAIAICMLCYLQG